MKSKLPDEWKEYRIREIGTVVTGNTPPKKYPENYGGSLPWIKPPDLDKEMYVSNSEETISDIGMKKVRLLTQGSVLVSCIGNIGKVAIADSELCTNQQINAIVPNKKIVNTLFLYYSIKRIRPYLESIASSAVVPLLNKTDFSNVKIELPPLETQHKIAAILEKAEETKKLRAQADELTQQFLQSLFIEMFGDPVINPKGWDTIKIADIVESIEAGWSVNGEHRFKEKNEYGVLKVSAVTKGIFLPDEHKTIKPGTVLKKVVTPEKGDVLFSCANTLELVGATCLIRENYTELLLPDKLWKINLNKNLILPEVFKFILSTPSMRGQISKKSTGTSGSMYNISMAKLKLIHIPIPTLEIQYKFSKIYDLYESTQKQQVESRNNLDYLFNALMQKAFKGDLIH